jgi:hypothetical protein
VTAPTGPGPSPGAGARTGATSARGIALLVGAVVLGIALLRATDPPDSLADASEGPERTASTAPSTTEEEPDESTTSSSSSSSTTEPTGDEALVLVANAANPGGVAGRLSVVVEDGGFAIAPPANATVDAQTSIVYFAPGFEQAAADVAELFEPRPTTAPLPDPPPVAAGDLAGATVIVVAGPDIAG